jgi:putative membrane protein
MDRKGIVQTGLALALAGLMVAGAAAQSSPSSTTPGAAGAQKDKSSSSKSGYDSSASSKKSSKLGVMDQHFVKKAAEGNLAEVELGKLATEKASSEDVKKFGQRMVDDHSKANEQLKQVASSKGVEVPSDLSAKDKLTKERLSKLSGEQFDKAYMNTMVKDHTQDVSEFKKESTSAKDPDVKNYASQTLPTLEDHLKQARSIAPKENKEARMEKKSKSANSQQ